MKRTILLVLMMAAAGAAPASAADGGEFQLSAYMGGQNLMIDDPDIVGDDRFQHDGFLVGLALAYRLKSGLMFEGSLLHSAYSIFPLANLIGEGFDNYQYAGAVGWQFDVNRWRITPKAGVARSKLTSDDGYFFPTNDGMTNKVYATVPFIETSLAHRAGTHWGFGLMLRETFEEFGHTRSYAATVQYFFN
jgi:hypothetical protein